MTKQDASPPPSPNVWVDNLKTLGVSVLLAFGIRVFVAEARYIPSESMVPTLEVNDRLLVEKISYRLHPPQRGDIVVFQPTQALQNEGYKDAFIKRVVGLPGDEVAVHDGSVFVNGKPLSERYLEGNRPNYVWGPERIPEGQYMVLGDNRNNSYDSHFWGFVPRDRIVGRAAFRFWPPQRVGELNLAGGSAIAQPTP
ncbi:signal peptidase I [Leptolyngbya sp. FACHB-261]|uniref:signal peptidase I n=1 Tax=Leptolyngbya sp. FACHB-261 TaxID=2692806 RepID=UPI0016869838|nr:signal peptidase I [Leptolyngbya sp. FACHB-261]MBD2104351.1 signal peptidase I [Leptolyngbya sp. FACHB-261]